MSYKTSSMKRKNVVFNATPCFKKRIQSSENLLQPCVKGLTTHPEESCGPAFIPVAATQRLLSAAHAFSSVRLPLHLRSAYGFRQFSVGQKRATNEFLAVFHDGCLKKNML